MLAYLLVTLAAMGAAGLTLYSGFGLGTLLLPVFTLFFPVEVAVLATAVVHGANNVFKVVLLGRHADRRVVCQFGLMAAVFAVLGAVCLSLMAEWSAPLDWTVGSARGTTTPVKLAIGVLMLLFALFELLPRFRQLEFQRSLLPLGGILSGFFGGLSGHQGALRSAFLAKTGLSTPAFVATNAVIGLLVDVVRVLTYLGVAYWADRNMTFDGELGPLVIIGMLAAFSGVLIARRFLHRVVMDWIQLLTGGLLVLVSVSLIFGLI